MNGEEPLHLGSAMEFSASVGNLHKLPISMRATAIRTTLDKHVQGRLYSKFAKTNEERTIFGQCPLCKQPDSQHHYLLDCNYPQAKKIRQDTLLEATEVITKIRQEQLKPASSQPTYRTNAVNTMSEAMMTVLTSHPHSHLIYTGRFSASLINSLRFHLGDMNQPSSSRWRSPALRYILSNGLLRITKVYAKAAKRLWSQRTSTALQVHVVLATLPPDSTASIPRIPHAEDRVRKAVEHQQQVQADAAENLTPEELGIIPPEVPPPPDPMAVSAPTISPPEEINAIVAHLTFVPRPRGHFRPFKIPPGHTNPIPSPPLTPPPPPPPPSPPPHPNSLRSKDVFLSSSPPPLR